MTHYWPVDEKLESRQELVQHGKGSESKCGGLCSGICQLNHFNKILDWVGLIDWFKLFTLRQSAYHMWICGTKALSITLHCIVYTCVWSDVTCERRWRWLTPKISTDSQLVHLCFLVTSSSHSAIVRYVVAHLLDVYLFGLIPWRPQPWRPQPWRPQPWRPQPWRPQQWKREKLTAYF